MGARAAIYPLPPFLPLSLTLSPNRVRYALESLAKQEPWPRGSIRVDLQEYSALMEGLGSSPKSPTFMPFG